MSLRAEGAPGVDGRSTSWHSRRGVLRVCAAGVLWGTGGLVFAVLHERVGVGALTISAWRMAIAAAALVGIALLTHRMDVVLETARNHPRATVLVGASTALYQALYFVSVQLAGVSISTVVSLGVAPAVALCWEHLQARSRPTVREVWVLASALAGLVLVSRAATHGSSTVGDQPALGVLMALAAGATYAATTVLGHPLAQRVDPLSLTTCATAVGAVILLPVLVVAAATGEPVLTADPTSIGLVLYLGVATLALAYGLLYAGLRTTSGSAATVGSLVEPISAAALAFALLGEQLGWSAVIGATLILGAVLGHDGTRPVS